VAIVGARNASAAALAFTERLARDVGQAGYVVVSGLARGVDTRAHRGSLDTGTIAVLAGGHDRIYPAENAPLIERMLAAGGAVVSEMPLGWEPRARDFPHRNRLVSGLTYGVVVVEAARRSGSLITARCALEQGREVFAVPGSPIDPRTEGTNDLIRSGATLCAAAEHVVSVLEPLIGAGFAPAAARRTAREGEGAFDFGAGEGGNAEAGDGAALPHEEPEGADAGGDSGVIARLLGPTPISIDELARQSGLPIRAVQMTLLELELAGRIERHGGNAVSLAPGR
jgi:DNA processing protein